MAFPTPMPPRNDFYAAYDTRHLPNHDEDAEIQTTKHEIQTIKKSTISSTQNALRLATQAESAGIEILERLGGQKETLLDAEEKLEEADIEMAVAGEKVRKISRLNRSLWGIIRNPFAMIRRARRIKRIEERRLRLEEAKRGRREGIQRRVVEEITPSTEDVEELVKDESITITSSQKRAERMRFQFEADSDDEEMEDEIDQSIEHLHGASLRLKNVGLAINQELEAQSTVVRRIVVQVDRNDDQVALNRHRQDGLRRR
ncbi:Glutamate decarboxylase 4 [Venturia nashicola]|uniref:Glutamate decarboxylase 4 n=1 Tax=Venturia nashicola TaxID=86259 RepID=A0A4Z1NQG9_9PEZI|nr:Glutamate decarboxylase 4 [Venturia nashicola]